jgi:putative phage-type endonuclease
MTDLVPVSENVEGPTVVGDARERWLAERREPGLITASDVAAILEIDPRRGPLAVYAEKIGATQPLEDEDWLAFGRDVEGAIAKGYTRKTGRPARDLGLVIQRHPDIPWLGATWDRETEGSELMPAPAAGPGPLEIKAVGGRAVAEWKDTEPTWYVVQLNIQMFVRGSAWGSLAPMFNGQTIEARDHLRNDRFLALAVPRLEEFRQRVLRREPPEETDGLAATSRAVRALFPGDGRTVPLDGPDVLDLVARWESAKHQRAASDAAAEEIENELRRRLDGATFGALLDGTYLRIKRSHRRGFTVAPTTYTVLDRFRPRIRRRA